MIKVADKVGRNNRGDDLQSVIKEDRGKKWDDLEKIWAGGLVQIS